MLIGIITVYDAVNYGSFLQAFCLQKILSETGHEVRFIKTSSFKYLMWRIRCLITYNPKKILFKYEFSKGFFSAWKNLSVTRKKSGFDTIIIGSDEMWQLNNLTLKPLKEFFGAGINARNIITYAVCSNDTVPDDIKRYKFITDGIKKISSISVRDQATYDAYRKFTDKDIAVTLDPTFLTDLSDFEKLNDERGYILVYTYGFNNEMIKKTIGFSKKVNKPLISVAQRFTWCDKSIPASPFEFLGLIKNADYIVTDTYHGTILSIKYHKNFAVFASHKRKVQKALEQFKLEGRNASEADDLSHIFESKIDYGKIDKIINKAYEESIEYLRANLSI